MKRYFSRIAEIFSPAGRSKTSPNLKFCSIKITHPQLIYNDFASATPTTNMSKIKLQGTDCIICHKPFKVRAL